MYQKIVEKTGANGVSARPNPEAAPPRSRSLAAHAVLLAGIIALAFLLRVYRLDDQSAWCDEGNFFFLSVPDLGTYVSLIRFLGPDNLPLYYMLFYAWSRIFGISLVAGRMLTILCGIACIPLAYALGRRIFDARAGWIAALCVAISPFQIWHAQSMRPYGLCIPLVLLSAYVLLRAQEGSRLWWGAAFAVNVVLLWTQAFMAFIIPVQILYLLGVRPKGLRRAVIWTLAQALVVLPPYLWLRPRLLNIWEPEFDHFTLPGLWRVVVDLLGDDLMRYSGEFPIAAPAWVSLFPGYETWGPAMGVTLMALFGVLTLWSIPKAVVCWRQGEAGPVLLLATAFLPVLMLVCLSYAWRPCVETRHTAYCSVALYLVAAGVITSIRRPVLRSAVLVALVGLLSLELAFFLPGVSRTQWRAAARHIESQQRPEDIILVKGIIPWAPDTFRANQTDHAIPVVSAHTNASLCNKTAAFFEGQRQKAPVGEDAGRVWAVVEMPFFDPQVLKQAFAARLGPSGIEGSYVFYPGMQGLLLCCFEQDAPPGDETGSFPEGLTTSVTDYDAILRDLGLDGLKAEEKRQAIGALQRVIDIPIPLGKNSYFTLGLLLTEAAEYDMGVVCARRSISLLPEFGPGHFALGVTLAAKGDIPAALEAFHEAFALDPVIDSLYGELVRALYETPNGEKTSRQLERLAATGFPYPVLRRLFLEQFPDSDAPDPGMASADPTY